ncbi:hypothetical protein SAE02_42640 [Skermanella aerolata]|uniref:Uncharacterized protein n=1 Tax=Skermanella aerolata TaxID=393310 RepID=A0A512DUG6_9PROT|nr:hypothetical protein N826_19115 [Skermanella aerolata KACC 11604]GEO40116.1 hypothetical protein SAE02_42640 [Skermanella aerolata]
MLASATDRKGAEPAGSTGKGRVDEFQYGIGFIGAAEGGKNGRRIPVVAISADQPIPEADL